MYLENKLKIKRTKKTLTVLIIVVLSFVFLVDQVYMAYFVTNSRVPLLVFNSTLNKSVLVIITVPFCVQTNTNLVLAQDMIIVFMRIILPFIFMVVCNVILIRHIRQSRNRVIRGRKEKKENSFTFAVAIINGSFLTFNFGVVVYYIIVYYFRFTGNYFGTSSYSVSMNIFSLYGVSAILLSYLFTLCQFFFDMIFNKIFRKEILAIFLNLSRRNQVEETRTQTQN